MPVYMRGTLRGVRERTDTMHAKHAIPCNTCTLQTYTHLLGRPRDMRDFARFSTFMAGPGNNERHTQRENRARGAMARGQHGSHIVSLSTGPNACERHPPCLRRSTYAYAATQITCVSMEGLAARARETHPGTGQATEIDSCLCLRRG